MERATGCADEIIGTRKRLILVLFDAAEQKSI